MGPRSQLLLYFILGVVALLAANSIYLETITVLEWARSNAETTYQNGFYTVMFGVHLAVGLLQVLPVMIYEFMHMWNALIAKLPYSNPQIQCPPSRRGAPAHGNPVIQISVQPRHDVSHSG